MPQDAMQIKEKILSILKFRGPSLPVHVAKETGLSMLFASAFLAELLSEKKIKISNMRVGSSPIYYLSGQEYKLENFSIHLKSKEKDAFLLLKEKKFLRDKEQEPAIRVALRAIKDFATPLQYEENIYWRYFNVPETEFKPIKPLQKTPQQTPKPQTEHEKLIQLQVEQDKKLAKSLIQEPLLNIFDQKIEAEKEQKPKPKPKKPQKAKPKKKDDKLFNKIKEELAKRKIEILDIEDFSKKELVLKVKIDEKEHILIVYDKKRINEFDIINAYKKSSEKKLPYVILTTGEPLKKINNLIEALKNLSGIEKIEE